jgi:hypothetical protein
MTYYNLNFYHKTATTPQRVWRRSFSSHALAVAYMVTLEPFADDTFATVTEESRPVSNKRARIESGTTDDLFTQGG